MRRVLPALLLFCATAAPPPVGAGGPGAPGAPAPLRLTPVGRYDFDGPAPADHALAPEELSGIARMEGDRYVAIGDEHACLHFLTIRVDPETGRVRGAKFGKPRRLKGPDTRVIPDSAQGGDREGIAYDPSTGSVWISNERTGTDPRRSSIARHSVRDGRRTREITTASAPALRIFERQRPNQGFESLTRSRDGWTAWTAAEGPLTVDGAPPTDTTGGVVRLQRFDKAMRATAQHAYLLDPYPARIVSPSFLAGREVSGLSELLLLPDARLLALERAFAGDSTGMAGLRIRIYEVDVSGATDLSQRTGADGLAGAVPGRDYAPAAKRLLWEESFGLTNSNFEGMALGPRLSNGDFALLLIADNNEGTEESIYALRLGGALR